MLVRTGSSAEPTTRAASPTELPEREVCILATLNFHRRQTRGITRLIKIQCLLEMSPSLPVPVSGIFVHGGSES
jgi:hypothetical protein